MHAALLTCTVHTCWSRHSRECLFGAGHFFSRYRRRRTEPRRYDSWIQHFSLWWVSGCVIAGWGYRRQRWRLWNHVHWSIGSHVDRRSSGWVCCYFSWGSRFWYPGAEDVLYTSCVFCCRAFLYHDLVVIAIRAPLTGLKYSVPVPSWTTVGALWIRIPGAFDEHLNTWRQMNATIIYNPHTKDLELEYRSCRDHSLVKIVHTVRASD